MFENVPSILLLLIKNIFLKLVSEEIAGSAAHNSDECSMLLYVHRDHKDYKDEEPRAATSTFTQLLSSG